MIKKQAVGFGLVGAGLGAKIHASQVAEMEQAEVVAVYGRNRERARSFADRHGVEKAYSDYREMLADGDVDAVIITTPTGLHLEFAAPAAEAGKHVVIEKPLEISTDRAEQIVAACRKHNVLHSVIYQLRFGIAANRVRDAIRSGQLGRVFLCDAYDKEYREPSYYRNDPWRGTRELEGGGALMTQSTHVIDLLQWLAGKVKSVYAKKKTAVHDIEVEDLAIAMPTIESGALGVLQSATSTYPGFKSRIEIHGENGSVIFNPEYDRMVFWRVKDSAERLDTPTDFDFADVSDPHLLPFIWHRRQLQDIAEAIIEGREPSVTAEDGLAAMRIKEAIYESAESGREVLVD